MDGEAFGSKTELRAHYGSPSERAAKKQLRALDRHCRSFIALSPFVVIATSGADGLADASPKGDAPGFVAVLDDVTLFIPDRIGNNRIDTLQNLVDNPGIGLIFFVPGINETLRVNGLARITADVTALGPHAVNGKLPQSGIVVAVKEAYFHCGKALIRSKLWDPATKVERSVFPSLGQVIADQIGIADIAGTEKAIETAYREKLY